MKVKKRNGNLVDFDPDKIKNAVHKAFSTHPVPEQEEEIVITRILDFLPEKDILNIEEIQDHIEYMLLDSGYLNIAKEFILYREKHKNLRDLAQADVDFIKAFIDSKNAANATIDDNSNVGTKGVGVLNAEIHKRINANTNMYLWENMVQELYPELPIKQMRSDFKSICYPHDFSSQILMAYCMAVSMYPFLLNGIADLGGKSATPKSLESFCGIFINLVFALASEVKGAVACPEVIMYMDYFTRKDYGEDYINHLDTLVGKRTLLEQIHQYFQQITYSINQVAGSRGMQSPFTNFSLFDRYFFEGMFGDFCFPDGSKPVWETTNWLQKEYLHWLNQERLKCILTFPVCSYACLVENDTFKDAETFDFICQEYSEGNSFFLYTSKSVDSLSSCCFSKNQKVLWKSSTTGVHLTTLEDLHNTQWEPEKKNLKIFHNGSWVSGKSIKLPNINKMYKVITHNNKEFIMTDNHINVTLDGEKQTSKLTTNDYLMFNTLPLQAVPENNEYLSYAQGFVIGAFLGDGSFSGEVKGMIYDINFSQNVDKYQKMMEMIDIANQQVGGQNKSKLNNVYNNVYPVRISSKELAAFIIKWTCWERGTYAYNKKLNLNCLLQSVDFRKGILDGWYNTDGGNSNRCYTTSKELAEDMEVLITSLGMQSIVNISDRTDEKVIIRGKVYDRNYPLYCVRWYEPANNRTNKDVEKAWIKKNNSIYFKVKSIEEVNYTDPIYCIECKNQDEPYFTLPCGLITHNCRLSNSIEENTFNFTNGQIGVMTGSKNVITLDLNRIMQDFQRSQGYNDFPIKRPIDDWIIEFKQYIINILDRVYKYQTAYNKLLHWAKDSHLYAAYDAGFIDLDKQYLTIGINGLNQMAEVVGIKCNNNPDYKRLCRELFSLIKEQNTLHRTDTERFNCEQVPAESAAIKLYNRDKKDGYWIPSDTNLYASYIFKPNDPEISVLDKIILHSSEFAADQMDGGQACHINLDSHLSKEQYRKLLLFAVRVGCKYLTFNIPNCECDDCGFIAKQPFDKCPKCGSTKVSLWDRIIGYLTKIKNWSEGRQIEQKTRIYSK